jgi:sensor histidine kinase YesM
LVENAIKHGISSLVNQGIIKINAKYYNDLLEISVEDNGPDFELGENSGYGLTSIQEKLRLLYGNEGKLTIENSPQKKVIITLPV